MIKIELSIRNILSIAGLVFAVWVTTKVWSVLLLAGVALMLAAALLPYEEWLRKRTKNRPLSVTLVVFTVLGALSLLLLLVVPPMIGQGQDLWGKAPDLQRRAADFADQRGWDGVRDNINSFAPSDLFSSRLVDASRTVAGVVFQLVTTFFLAAYIMLDARRLKQFLYFSTPRSWHPHIFELLPALQRVVGGYIRGQAITSGVIAAFTFVLLFVLRVPNAVALAALAAVADLLPFVGGYILFALVVVPALSVSVTTAVIAGAAMAAYQQFEDRIFVPRVYGATLRLPTIAVVLSILIGAELLGFVGALVALPIAAAARVVVEYFAKARTSTSEDAGASVTPEEEVFAPNEDPPGNLAGQQAAGART